MFMRHVSLAGNEHEGQSVIGYGILNCQPCRFRYPLRGDVAQYEDVCVRQLFLKGVHVRQFHINISFVKHLNERLPKQHDRQVDSLIAFQRAVEITEFPAGISVDKHHV